jgi:hypothetical protein
MDGFARNLPRLCSSVGRCYRDKDAYQYRSPDRGRMQRKLFDTYTYVYEEVLRFAFCVLGEDVPSLPTSERLSGEEFLK